LLYCKTNIIFAKKVLKLLFFNKIGHLGNRKLDFNNQTYNNHPKGDIVITLKSLLMKKILLLISIVASLSVSAQIGISYNWSLAATVTGNKQTTEHQPLPLDDGKIIAVTSVTSSAGFKFGNTEINLYDEGTTISPANIVFNNLNSDGTINWTINSTLGGISYNSGSLAAIPGKDIAMAVFSARFNAKGLAATEVAKFRDALGNTFSVPMTCPADYNPYKGIIMTFKPSNGEILSVKGIESVYQSATGNNCAQPLFLQGVAANKNGFFITGYAYTETTFPGGLKFIPEKVPADWNGSSVIGNGFIAALNEQGECTNVIPTIATSDDREGNYLIQADDNDLYVIGQSNHNLIYFNYDSELNKKSVALLPIKEASNGSHNVLLKELNVANKSIYVTGHLAGGFEGTNIATTGTGSNQFGFVIKIDTESGTIIGGGVEDGYISGYYGAFENKSDGYTYAVGYNLGQKKAFLQPYTSTWDKLNRIELFTTTGTPAIWPASFSKANNALLVPCRSNNKCTFGSTTIAEGFTAFSGFLASYDMGDFKLTAVDQPLADSIKAQMTVRGETGRIVFATTEATSVQIYNIAGCLVRVIDIPAGETTTELPAGFYIAAGQKVIVQ